MRGLLIGIQLFYQNNIYTYRKIRESTIYRILKYNMRSLSHQISITYKMK